MAHTEIREQTITTTPRRAWYRKPLFYVPLICVASLVALYFLLNNLIMPLYVHSGSVAVVPSVVGMKQDDAVKKISDAGYEAVKYEVRFDDKSAEGTIIRQTPEAGEETKPGRKVFLVISGGKEMVMVPDLRGKMLRDAKMLLLKANLNIGNVDYVYTDSASNGTIYKQTPVAGIKINTSTKVDLTVSQGPLMGRVPVPDLTKLTLSDAIAKLTANRLSLGKVTFEAKPDGVPNTVMDQYPTQGELLTEGSTVDVFVVREDNGATKNLPEH